MYLYKLPDNVTPSCNEQDEEEDKDLDININSVTNIKSMMNTKSVT